METQSATSVSFVLNRPLVFVHGKGGVGKTVVSQAIAHALAKQMKKTLWVTIEDPTRPPGQLSSIEPYLWYLNCDFTQSFEEYAGLKIGAPRLTHFFLKNKLIRSLAKAAPGIHELVLLGKLWFEQNHYSHVIVDMPSTGYGLALFQSAENFSKLFGGGPLYRDAEKMLETFRNPLLTGNLIVALPEEMPLRESLDLSHFLQESFPKNPPAFIVNRLFPPVPSLQEKPPQSLFQHQDARSSPLPKSAQDYVEKRYQLEQYNLRIWRDEKISFGELSFIPPFAPNIFQKLTSQLIEKAYL